MYNFCTTRFSLFMHISIFFWKKMSTTIKQTTAQRPRSGASIEAEVAAENVPDRGSHEYEMHM